MQVKPKVPAPPAFKPYERQNAVGHLDLSKLPILEMMEQISKSLPNSRASSPTSDQRPNSPFQGKSVTKTPRLPSALSSTDLAIEDLMNERREAARPRSAIRRTSPLSVT